MGIVTNHRCAKRLKRVEPKYSRSSLSMWWHLALICSSHFLWGDGVVNIIVASGVISVEGKFRIHALKASLNYGEYYDHHAVLSRHVCCIKPCCSVEFCTNVFHRFGSFGLSPIGWTTGPSNSYMSYRTSRLSAVETYQLFGFPRANFVQHVAATHHRTR